MLTTKSYYNSFSQNIKIKNNYSMKFVYSNQVGRVMSQMLFFYLNIFLNVDDISQKAS